MKEIVNLLSAGLGALSGAMTAPGAADTFAGSELLEPVQMVKLSQLIKEL